MNFLLIAIGVTALACALILLAVVRHSLLRWVGGIAEWAWAGALLVIASLLFGEGATRSVGWMRFAANVAMFAGFFMMYVSLRKFSDTRLAYRWLGTAVAVLAIVLAVLMANDAGYAFRAICVVTAHLVLFSACAWTMRSIRHRSAADRFVQVMFLLLTTLSIARLFAIATGLEHGDLLEASSTYQRAYLLVFATAVATLTIGYILMVGTRLQQVLHRLAQSGTFDRLGDSARQRIERELRGAIERGELVLHYQPRICMRTEKILAVEALVRWNHPLHGTMLPTEFVPICEETTAIIAIGAWVLDHAAAQLTRLTERGFTGLGISVNISAHQLVDATLPAQLARILQSANFGSHQLELELTESSVIHNRDTAKQLLSDLKKLGVRLSVDDFGTGYSSLAYIKHWPIDCVKIDRSFVSDLPDDSGNAAITRAITAMGHALGLHVVAEGVENREQLDFLRTLGCDEYQGFLVSEPLPEAELMQLLELRRAAKSTFQSGEMAVA